MNHLQCEFISSSINPKLAYCKFCNRVVSVDNSQLQNSLCAIKLHEAAMDPNNNHVKLIKTETIQQPVAESINRIECSQEQIDARMDICKQCPFFQINSCLQCGCALSRDRNYKNKLYFADQSCPIGKWGPIS